MKENKNYTILEILQSFDRKYDGPIFDSHTHIRQKEDVTEMVKYAEKYNVRKMVGIMWEDKIKEIKGAFPDTFVFARFINLQQIFEKGNTKTILKEVEEDYEKGFAIAKVWFAPRWKDYVKNKWDFQFDVQNFSLNEPILEPVFSLLEDLGSILLLHVSDPDILYKTNYQPESYYGSKSEHLLILEKLLENYPKLRIIGAHMGGQPEHLDNLGKWLDKYPNLYVDTASAKWMIRSFSPEIEKARKFFIKYSERILFGTDIIAGRKDREPIPEYYIDRYLSYQALFETSIRGQPLPIPDPDNDNNTKIDGLSLPKEVLEKIYWKNPIELFQ